MRVEQQMSASPGGGGDGGIKVLVVAKAEEARMVATAVAREAETQEATEEYMVVEARAAATVAEARVAERSVPMDDPDAVSNV